MFRPRCNNACQRIGGVVTVSVTLNEHILCISVKVLEVPFSQCWNILDFLDQRRWAQSSDVDLCWSAAVCTMCCRQSPGVLRRDLLIFLDIKVLRCRFGYHSAVLAKAFNRWQTYEGGAPAINSWVLCCFAFLCRVERMWSCRSFYLDFRLYVLIRTKKRASEDKWDASKCYWVFKSSLL